MPQLEGECCVHLGAAEGCRHACDFGRSRAWMMQTFRFMLPLLAAMAAGKKWTLMVPRPATFGFMQVARLAGGPDAFFVPGSRGAPSALAGEASHRKADPS